MKLKISVVVPCYNGQYYLPLCLSSLTNQSVKPFEIIVVDDCSQDKSIEVALAYKAKVVRHSHNKGIAETLNDGIKEAQGDIIVFIDQDCVASRDLLAIYQEDFEKDPELACVGGQMIEANPRGIVNVYRMRYWSFTLGKQKKINPTTGFVTACSAFRRDALLKIGLFSPEFKAGGQDWDLHLRMLEAGMKLLYDARAVVYHFRDDDIFSFLKRMYNCGYYATLALAKHGKRKFRLHRTLVWIGETTLKFLLEAVRRRDPIRVAIGFLEVIALSLGETALWLHRRDLRMLYREKD